MNRYPLGRTTLVAFSCFALLAGGAWLSGGGESSARAQLAQESRHFAPTGYTVSGAFLSYFDRYGGVRIFGYPISGEITEDGRTVQYFERQRFEYHKEFAGTQYEVLLGQLGTELGRGKVSLDPIAQGATPAGSVFVPETRHSLGAPFLEYWRANGGVRVLGYPISEPVTLNGFLTQYFERARLEYHPEKVALGFGVELGHLGREYVQSRPGVAGAIAAGPKPGPAPTVVPSTGRTRPLTLQELELLDLVNAGRVKAKLAPVELSGDLLSLSVQRSQDMAERGYYAHVTPEGKNFIDLMREAKIPFRFGGEILSKNNYREDLTAQRTYEGWMNSPTHRAIIMDARFTVVGVGEAKDSKGFYLFTMIFAQR